MKSLRIQVERVVRPFVASPTRKDRMREELLAHLTQMFEEERTKAEDEPAAIAAAIRRFGDAKELTRELQATVPWIERGAFFSLPKNWQLRRRADESPIRFILRSNGWAIGFSALGSALVLMVGLLIIHWNHRSRRADQVTDSQLILFFVEIIAIQGVAMISAAVLCEVARRALEARDTSQGVERRRMTWRVAGYVLAATGVTCAAIAGVMIAVNGMLPFSLFTPTYFWLTLVLAPLVVGPLTLWHAFMCRATNRRFELWESLELGE